MLDFLKKYKFLLKNKIVLVVLALLIVGGGTTYGFVIKNQPEEVEVEPDRRTLCALEEPPALHGEGDYDDTA